MNPEIVDRLNPDTRKRLHAMAEMDVYLQPPRMPVVPPSVPGSTPSDEAHRLAVARWRDEAERVIFPPDAERSA